MKDYKHYLILTPLLLITLGSFYASYFFFDKMMFSQTLANTINEQLLFKNVVRSLMRERNAITSQTPSADEIAFARGRTDDDVSALLDARSDESITSLTTQINAIRDNMDNAIKYSTIFFSFYSHINSFINENYAQFINNEETSESIRDYIVALSLIYQSTNNLNLDREYIAQAIINNEEIGKKSVSRWLINRDLEALNVSYLPTEESRLRVSKFIEASEISSIIGKMGELLFSILEGNKPIVSKEELVKIDEFERDKFSFLIEVSNIIESELSIANKHLLQFYEMWVLIFIFAAFAVLFMLLALARGVKTTINLQNAINGVRVQIDASKKDISGYEILEYFAKSYNDLKRSFEYLNEFNNIKNGYLEKISKKHKLNFLDKFQSLAFLRKTLTSAEQVKAINVLEENYSKLSVDLSNIEKIIHFESRNIVVENTEFDPQEIFKIALESRLDEIKDKQINYVTFVDPRIKNELSGDKNKIISIISNVLSCAIYQCSQYAKVSVEIRQASDNENADISTIRVDIKNNADFMGRYDIEAVDEHKVPSIKDEFISFWLSISNIYLKSLGSNLEINGTKDTGNEFSFTLVLKTHDIQKQKERFIRDIKIAYISDTDEEYNEFFKETMMGMHFGFETFTNFNKIKTQDDFDVIFTRSNKDNQDTQIKHLIKLRDPLTPSKILQYLQSNVSLDDKQKFILNKPQILILEDNIINLNLIKYAFERYNVEITAINEYRNILEIIKKRNFDVIFMDTGLLGVNSIEIAKKYKSSEISKHTPMVAMISNTSHVSSSQALEVFDDCIKKPFSKKELNRILTSFIVNFDAFSKNESTYAKSQNILIFKKSSIENKIITSALPEFSKFITIANNFDEFKHDLKTTPYGLIFIDEGVKGFEAQKLVENVESARMSFGTNTKLFIFSNKSQSSFSIKHYIKILSPQISKEQVADIVKQEFGVKVGSIERGY